MIAKQIKGKDFYGVLAYHEKKAAQGVAYVIDSNISMGNATEMAKEFNIVRQLRPSLSRVVYHVSLNLPPSESFTDSEFVSFGNEYLRGMGFDDNQFIIYRHTDEEHQHIHIVANRVTYKGEVVSDSKDYKRSEEVLRQLEKKYGIVQVVNTNRGRETKLTQKEIAKTFRTGEVPVKLILQKKVKEALSLSNNVSQFILELEKLGVSPQLNQSRSTGRVSGISFKYQDIIYKGSSLGKKFSWNNLIKEIDYEQTRDRSAIHNANAKERGANENDKGNGTSSNIDGTGTGEYSKSLGHTAEQPKGYLEQTTGTGIIYQPNNETDWTPFRLELHPVKSKKKSKRRRKRKGKSQGNSQGLNL